ncbi:hypothetical protein BJ912DRAFT_941737 [Pholiota molesta]|nr:hypothetical protein BJ912DRAFT_941737 [Pholiota molesta]
MPLTLANPDRPRRAPLEPPSRSSSSSSCISAASTSADTHVHAPAHTTPSTATHTTDRLSLRSFVSASEATAVSDHPTVTKALGYSDTLSPKRGGNGTYSEKLMPPQRSDSGDYYVDKHSSLQYDEPLQIHPTRAPAPIRAFATTAQLAAALGPDNAPHTTEIAAVPCAGVRIPHGPLTGLLAWRLIVRDPRPGPAPLRARRRASWWVARREMQTVGSVNGVGRPPPPGGHAYSYSDQTLLPPPTLKELDGSTASLPARRGGLHSPGTRPHSVMTLFAHPAPSDAVAANFILDTSLPHSIIARGTLRALGYAGGYANDSGERDEEEEDEVVEVAVTVQGVQTVARIARAGEAGRLGVQFLRDAGVSVFFPKDGDGVGPVLYYESARALRDVPLTIPTLPPHRHTGGARERWKPTLPQRVRSFLGLPPAAAS